MEKSFTASAIRKRKWRDENPERYLKGGRENAWRRAGIDVDYANKLRDSTDRCEICRRKDKSLCVDHCHETGFPRGMLCNRCNLSLGLFGDSAELLRIAADYLDNHRGMLYN